MFRIISFMMVWFLAFPVLAQEAGDLKTALPNDRILGDKNAKVTLIEYASLSCPHCAEFHISVLPAIQKEYIDSGKVRFIFRDFPLNAPAVMGSQLTQCVAKHNGNESYFSALKILFEQQKDWTFAQDVKAKLAIIAKGVGLDEKTFEACLQDKEIETFILTSRLEADKKLGINSTPSFLINGEKAEHLGSVEAVRKALDTVLGGKSLAQEATENAKKVTKIQPSDALLGKEDAPVTIVEYANIACPHCAQFHKDLLSLLQKDYIDAGKVKFVFRELPMNPNAFYAFMTAHCKGKDQFFPILSTLIDSVRDWSGTPAFVPVLRDVAVKSGISREEFYACIENKDIEKRIQDNAKTAFEILGIQHSPAIYVNGEKVGNIQTPELVRQAIDSAIKK